MSQTVKNLPAMQETWVQSLGGEDPLEKEMATYSSILACRILWTEEPSWATVHGVAELDMTEHSTAATSLGCLSLSLISLCPLGRLGDQFMNQHYVSYGEER